MTAGPASDASALDGVVAIASAPTRRAVAIVGRVTRMHSAAPGKAAAFDIRITDASGSAMAQWTGRRSIAGLALGGNVRIDGVGRLTGTVLTFVNPAYTLL